MKINDLIWGKVEIKDPQIIKIINHPAMQRLKKIWISAYGYLFNLKRNSTRYEHSLGVYLLLRKFKASKEEQLAGLIHDISTTALSHVSTYANHGKYTEVEYHELKQQEYINSSGLGKLLEIFGFKTKDLLHEDSFPLLENKLPDICADRIDYALRDSLHLQTLTRQQVNQVLKGLTIHNREFIFKNKQAAFIYALNFYLLNLMFYGSATEAHFNNHFGKIVKLAMKKKILKEKDWFSDDIKIINKLKRSKDKTIKKRLAEYNNRLVVYEDSQNPDIIFPKKIRIVDPKVLINKTTKRLSQIDSTYKRIITDYQKTHQKHELPVKILYKK